MNYERYIVSYTKKVAFNTGAQMVGKLVGTVISLMTVAALFRYLGVEGIGKYTTVWAFVGFFAVFADFGLQWTLIRELAVDRDHEKVFKNIFTLRILVALIIHGLSFAAVWFFNYPLDVKLGVGIINAAWFFTTVNSVLVGVFLNNYRLDISVTAEVISRLVILGFILLFARSGASFNTLMLSYVFGNAVMFLFNLIFVKKFSKLGLAFDMVYWRHAFLEALPIGIVLVFGFIYYKIDSIMLSVMKGMTDVGIYGTAYKLLEVLQTMPSMFLGAAFPLVTRYAATQDDRLKGAFQKQFDFLMLLAVPTVVLVFVLASPIIVFIAGGRGEEFIHTSTVTFLGHSITSVTTLKILIISVGINFISNLYSYMIISLGKQRSMVYPTIGFALLNVVLNLSLIPYFSYLGAAVATLVTEVIVATVYYFVMRKNIHLPVRKRNFAKILLAGLLTGGALYLTNLAGIGLFVNIAIGFALYACLVLLFDAVPLETVKAILRREE